MAQSALAELHACGANTQNLSATSAQPLWACQLTVMVSALHGVKQGVRQSCDYTCTSTSHCSHTVRQQLDDQYCHLLLSPAD